MAFCVYQLCNHHHNPLESISTPLKEPPVCFQPPSQPEATPNPSVSTNVPLLDTSCKRNQMRVSFQSHNALQVRPRCSGYQYSTSLTAEQYSLCGYTTIIKLFFIS